MPLVRKIKDASRLGRPLEVRYATKSIKKFHPKMLTNPQMTN